MIEKYLILLALVMGIVLLSSVAYQLFSRRRLLSRETVFLELTPPTNTSKTPEATQLLFSVIHGHHAARTQHEKILRRKVIFSFEIISTKQNGIRYIIQVDNRHASSLQQAFMTYLPDVKVKSTTGFMKTSTNVQVVEFKQTNHFAFPLAEAQFFEKQDSVSFITGALTNLGAQDFMGFQVIVEPIESKEAKLLAEKILGNEDLLTKLSSRTLGMSKLTTGINKLLFGLTGAAGDIYHGSTKQSYNLSQRDVQHKLDVAKRLRPARTLSAFELELMESMHSKVNQPLFRANIRVLIIMDKEASKGRMVTLRTALSSYSVPSYQALKAKFALPFTIKRRQYVFENRLPNLWNRTSSIFSASELASLYRFPDNTLSKTDNLITSLSKTLPAPISLKQQKKDANYVIGMNYHHGVETLIALSDKDRERHVYIIGGTGNGKTTMLQYGIVQDMKAGKGMAIIDPHGDMAETMLQYVPEDRIDDVIYFNPDDIGYPIGLNLLELDPSLAGDELLREKDLITESVISVFRKIFSEEDTGGHRIEYVLRNTIQTALTVPDATLFTVFDLLNDPKYRKTIVKDLENKDLKNFWKYELGKAGDMQKVKMAAGITAKIGRFLFSASAKRILEQPKSTIDFNDIINSGKILICNFSKGLLGEDTSELFGITVLAKLQLASLRRARLQQADRQPFYLYVDEFQNFATASFVQMLSESRKYKLYMIMAEQSTSQQKDQQMVNIILANVGTVLCFRTGNPADEKLLLPLFQPYIEQGDIANLPIFNFYTRLAAVASQEPLSGGTLLLEPAAQNNAQSIIARSRKNFSGSIQANPVIKSVVDKPELKLAPQIMIDEM